MPRVTVPFVGGAYAGRSLNQNPQECVNFFLETDTEGGKSPLALYGTPGLKVWYDTGFRGVEIRGMFATSAPSGGGSSLYYVVGNRFYRISNSFVTDYYGDLTTSTGPVRMAWNDAQLMIVDDYEGYIYDGSALTFAQITDADFPANVRGCAYLDGYFITSEKITQKFYISALLDGTDWDALDFASAEGYPDTIVDILTDHREVWIFGAETTEVFYNAGSTDFPYTGTADFPLQRVQGAFLEIGCASRWCAAKLDNSVYWLTDHGTLVRAEGYNPQIVSTRQIEYQWQNYTWSDAIAFTYHWHGHAFYQITFPTDGYTWVYDASNGSWHRRVSYPRSGTGVHGRHRANCYAFFDGKHLVGDFENGVIYEMDDATYTDNSETIHRWRTTQVMNEKDVNLFVHSLQVDFEAGTGLVTGQGSSPQAMLQLSKDGGHTWSNEYWVGTGKMGEYSRRAIWRRLGTGRNLVAKVAFSDPVKWVITGAVAEVTAGQH